MVLNFLAETFVLGMKNIYLHKMRSFLTMLGIIFGVTAVIVMVAIGEGGKQAALEQVRQLGARNIVVRSIPPVEGNDASGKTQRTLTYGLKAIDLQRLRELPGLAAIVPMRNTQQKVVYGERRAPINAIGAEPGVFDLISLRADRGRTFNQVDLDNDTRVCVLGATAAQQLFPYQNPIGEIVQVGGGDSGIVMLEVVGVLERTGLGGSGGAGIIDHSPDQDLYFPLTVARKVFGDTIIRRMSGSIERKQIELTEIWMQAKKQEEVESLASIVENVVRAEHKGPLDFEVKMPIELLRNAERLNRLFNFIMGGIASLSLVVGGIGIMNIMLASVTERTKEIGIRRALGAKRRHITLQFLVETTVISLAGGIIGVGLGTGIALGLPHVMKWFDSAQVYPTQIAPWSVLGSFIISALIGIVFGLYPAITAAHMNPIEALRHE